MLIFNFKDNSVEEESTLSSSISPMSEDDLLLFEREEMGREARLKKEKHEIKSKSWIYGILDVKDLFLVNPIQVSF
jgi:hypothetical protein